MSVAAHIQTIYAKSTNVTAVSGDKVDGLDSASFSESIDMVDANFIGGSGYKSRVPTLKDTSLDISGHYKSADAPQTLIRTSHGTGATVYMTVIFDGAASAGSQGKRVPMLVESYEEQLTTGDVVQWSAKLVGNGSPTNV